MVKFLMKTPLTAIIFAALWHFLAVFQPVSQSYSEALIAFQMPWLGYIYMLAYGLWLSIIAALVMGETKDRGLKPVLFMFLIFAVTQWFTPAVQQLWFGEVTGAMTRSDLWFKMACGGGTTLLWMALLLLLFKHPPAPAPHVATPLHPAPPAPDKYKLKKLKCAIKIIVLPFIYCVIYFLAWYFLLRRVEDARIYYGNPERETFVKDFVHLILLSDAWQVPVAFVKGLAYAIGLFPLLLLLPAKRLIFILSSIMLLAGPAIQMLIPSPVMPDAVRMAHLIELAATAVVYGGLAGIMLHTSVYKLEKPAPSPLPPLPVKPKAAEEKSNEEKAEEEEKPEAK